jgi:hypothetical protein
VTATEHELSVDATRRLNRLGVNYAVVMPEGVPVGCFGSLCRESGSVGTRATAPDTPPPLGLVRPGRRRRPKIIGLERPGDVDR